MSLWSRLFGKKEPDVQVSQDPKPQETPEWVELEKYLPAQEEDRELVSVIATAIAAGDAKDSQFTVKKVYQRNPEYVHVALIAAAVTAGAADNAQLRVKAIYQKNQ